MLFFGKKSSSTGRAISLYKPEPVNTDRHSKWRKPNNAYLDSTRAKTRQLNILKSFTKTLSILNVVIALCIFIALIVLLFFTDFERVVFDDGTYLSCIIEPDGTIVTKF